MVLHIRCDAKLYFKSIKTMVTMLKIMVTMLILLIKLPRIFPAQDSPLYGLLKDKTLISWWT